MTLYTSLELSKKLQENGCKLKSEYYYNFNKYSKVSKLSAYKDDVCLQFPTYDIIYDICIKYAKEFFGKKMCLAKPFPIRSKAYELYPQKILTMLQQNNPQKKIEDYIWEHCLFNPKNKEGK